MADATGLVYFIEARQVRRVKIGWSAVPIEVRLGRLQTGSPVKLKLLGCMPGTRADEARLHRQFEALRVRASGEWFQLTPELREFIATQAPADPPSIPARLVIGGPDELRGLKAKQCEFCGASLGHRNNRVPYTGDDGSRHVSCLACLERGRVSEGREVTIAMADGRIGRFTEHGRFEYLAPSP